MVFWYLEFRSVPVIRSAAIKFRSTCCIWWPLDSRYINIMPGSWHIKLVSCQSSSCSQSTFRIKLISFSRYWWSQKWSQQPWIKPSVKTVPLICPSRRKMSYQHHQDQCQDLHHHHLFLITLLYPVQCQCHQTLMILWFSLIWVCYQRLLLQSHRIPQ